MSMSVGVGGRVRGAHKHECGGGQEGEGEHEHEGVRVNITPTHCVLYVMLTSWFLLVNSPFFFVFFESICILAYSSKNKPGCSYEPLHLGE
jgi:hypothetical protein